MHLLEVVAIFYRFPHLKWSYYAWNSRGKCQHSLWVMVDNLRILLVKYDTMLYRLVQKRDQFFERSWNFHVILHERRT